VRLVEDDVTYSTFAEVYELNCARYGREADLPIAKFKEDLNQAIASQVCGCVVRGDGVGYCVVGWGGGGPQPGHRQPGMGNLVFAPAPGSSAWPAFFYRKAL